MKRVKPIICAIGVLHLWNNVAIADDPFLPPTITLKATGGEFENWIKSLPCKNGQFSTILSISDIDPTQKWEGAAQIILRPSVGAADGDYARFNLQTFQTRTPLVARAQQTRVSGHEASLQKEFHFSGQFQLGQPIAVDMEWAGGQDVSVTVAGKERASMHLQNVIGAIELVGSGGTVLFDKNVVACNDAANAPSTTAKPDALPSP